MAQLTKVNMTVDLYEYFAEESITVTTAVKSLTSTSYTDSDGTVAQIAIISVNDGGRITYRVTGANPTASAGIIITPMSIVKIVGQDNIRNFRIIRSDSSNGQIFVTYGR